MTRRTFALVALLALSACVDVKDFGAYWAKGTLDAELAGRWKVLAVDNGDKNPHIGKIYEAIAKDGSYEVAVTDEDKGTTAIWHYRTLKAGPYQYLLNNLDGKTKGGLLTRYEVTHSLFSGTKLKVYYIETGALAKFIAERQLKAHSFKRTEFGGLTISKLDDAVFEVLSAIPADTHYWKLSEQYEKTK